MIIVKTWSNTFKVYVVLFCKTANLNNLVHSLFQSDNYRRLETYIPLVILNIVSLFKMHLLVLSKQKFFI